MTLYLPTASPVAEDSQSDRAADALHRGTGSILVVEDDADVRDVSISILEGLGYRTLVARNGEEALEALRGADPIDLLFTDLIMPGGMSGIVLARQARTIRPGVHVLLTTGYSGMEPPTTDEIPIISKPFRAAELSKTIARMIGQSPRQVSVC